jgi:hypothetical protein
VNADVQRVREWLESQPFELRMVTLILLMTETVESQHGTDVRRVFERELKEAYRNLRGNYTNNPKLSCWRSEINAATSPSPKRVHLGIDEFCGTLLPKFPSLRNSRKKVERTSSEFSACFSGG